jgi:uncharacterized protein (TIGR00297 family)
MTSAPARQPWTKAIPPPRDRLQSRLLVWIVAPILCALNVRTIALRLSQGVPQRHYLLAELTVSLGFALLVSLLKAATPAAAACGGAICLLLIDCAWSWPPSLLHSGLSPLALLFLLTFAATRYDRPKKEARGLSEPRTGRRASQVIANLGIAAICAAFSSHSSLAYAAAIAALAEAAADTVSSEIGQAVAGPAILISTFHRVPPGTDGAISLTGTLSGIAAAALVAATGAPALGLSPAACLVAFAAAVLGLFFDSLLGATLERRGYIGNDLVNFTSTAFAAALALLTIRFGQPYLLR